MQRWLFVALVACGGAHTAEIDPAIAARIPSRGVMLTTAVGTLEETVIVDLDGGRVDIHPWSGDASRRTLAGSRLRDLRDLVRRTRGEPMPSSNHVAAFRRRVFIVDGDDQYTASFDGPGLAPSSAAGLVAELRAVGGLQ
jgi:hypothetical protein